MTKPQKDSFLTGMVIALLILLLLLAFFIISTERKLQTSISQNKYNIESIKNEKISYVPVNIIDLNINTQINALLNNPKQKNNLYNKIDDFTGNREITTVILKHAIEKEIPIGLAMGICWTESRFHPKAINVNGNDTKDWGLFQINEINLDSSWNMNDKLDIEKNTKRAMEILSDLMFKHNKNIVLVITAYNAGSSGIKDGISYRTLLYLNSTLTFKNKFEKEMNEFILNL